MYTNSKNTWMQWHRIWLLSELYIKVIIPGVIASFPLYAQRALLWTCVESLCNRAQIFLAFCLSYSIKERGINGGKRELMWLADAHWHSCVLCGALTNPVCVWMQLPSISVISDRMRLPILEFTAFVVWHTCPIIAKENWWALEKIRHAYSLSLSHTYLFSLQSHWPWITFRALE